MTAEATLDAVKWLRQLRMEAVEIGTPAMLRLATTIEVYFAGVRPRDGEPGLTFDRAAGLATEQGTVPWYAEEDKAARRQLVIAALRCFAGRPSERADAMLKGLRDYARTAWPRDRKYQRLPLEVGPSEQAFFAIMKAGGLEFVPGYHTLRKWAKPLIRISDP